MSDLNIALKNELKFYSNLLACHAQKETDKLVSSEKHKPCAQGFPKGRNFLISDSHKQDVYKGKNNLVHLHSHIPNNKNNPYKKSNIFHNKHSLSSNKYKYKKKSIPDLSDDQVKKTKFNSINNSSNHVLDNSSSSNEKVSLQKKTCVSSDQKIFPVNCNESLGSNMHSLNLMNEIVTLTKQLKETFENITSSKQSNQRSKKVPEILVQNQNLIKDIPFKIKHSNTDSSLNFNEQKNKTFINKLSLQKIKLECSPGNTKIKPICITETNVTNSSNYKGSKNIKTFKTLVLQSSTPRKKCAKKKFSTPVNMSTATSSRIKNIFHSKSIRKSISPRKLILSKYKIINKQLSRESFSNTTYSSGHDAVHKRKTPKYKNSVSRCTYNLNNKKLIVSKSKAKICTPLKGTKKNNFSYVKSNQFISKSPKTILRSKYKVIKRIPSTPRNNAYLSKYAINKSKRASCDLIKVEFKSEIEDIKKSLNFKSEMHLQPILRKRIFKNKNTIINKNCISIQTRAAKMVKTKYFVLNKKFRAPAQSHMKMLKGYSRENKVWKKNSARKLKNLPTSREFANRVIHKSIHHVLSASAKKKVSKINTFCMFYNRFGRCNKGETCLFVHDPSKIAICTRFLRGTCKKEKCLFSHEISPGKMALCTFFLMGICKKKDCPYRHEKIQSSAQMCKAFMQGYCSLGDKCKNAHVLACIQYIRGTCSNKDSCLYPHPIKNEKIRSTSVNEAKTSSALEALADKNDRYFLKNPELPSKENVVVCRKKNLPEQPSFISLSLNEKE